MLLDELGEDAGEMARADDQQVIEALPTNGADPALRVGIRVRRSDRGAHDLGSDRSPHVVEGPRELGGAVTDQVTLWVPKIPSASADLHFPPKRPGGQDGGMALRFLYLVFLRVTRLIRLLGRDGRRSGN